MDAGARHGRRRIRFLMGSVAALLVSIGLFAYTGYEVLSVSFTKAMSPVAEFDEHELRRVEWDEDATPLILALVVDSSSEAMPAMDVHVRRVGGDEVSTWKKRGWSSFFGRVFLHAMVIEPDEARTPIEVEVDVTEPGSVDGRADFVLLRHPEILYGRYVQWASGWWAGGGAALLISFGLLLVAVFWRGRVEV